MITLLASIGGFLSSILPELFRFLQDKTDKSHELAVLDKQIEMAKLQIGERLEEIGGQIDVAETQALYSTYNTGITWVDAYNATVRPTIAYAEFLLYAASKIMLYFQGTPWQIWGEIDQAVFAAIISFYFGARAMQKMRGK